MHWDRPDYTTIRARHGGLFRGSRLGSVAREKCRTGQRAKDFEHFGVNPRLSFVAMMPSKVLAYDKIVAVQLHNVMLKLVAGIFPPSSEGGDNATAVAPLLAHRRRIRLVL
jgi:hypothetical protein